MVFDPSYMSYQSNIPSEFVWPDHEKPSLTPPELYVPPIDLKAFLSGDPEAVSIACSKVNDACKKHGFFHIVNHGVDRNIIAKAHKLVDDFFLMSVLEKERAQRKLGDHFGYAGSFVGRFAAKLPWKETLSLRYLDDASCKTVQDYIVKVLGEDFSEFG